MSANDPKRTLAAIFPDSVCRLSGYPTPRELTDPDCGGGMGVSSLCFEQPRIVRRRLRPSRTAWLAPRRGGSSMAISPTFQRYLATKNVVYDIVAHEPTKSAMRTAEACRVSGDRVAKAVVLRVEYGYVLAILPASHQIRLDALRTQLGLDVDLAAEYEIEELFDDCVPGAIPPVGECYGLDTVVDDSIEEQPEVYLEGGDHATLVHMTHAQFASLTATARHGTFSVHA